MKRPTYLALVLLSILGCASCITRAEFPNNSRQPSQSVTKAESVEKLIDNLSATAEKRKAAEQELITMARESEGQRQRVIQATIQDVAKHDDLTKPSTILRQSLDYWTSVTTIFSTLRAVEAVDVMIRCIYCGNGLTGSLSQRPAFDALSRMGELAVPKLSEALINNPDDYARAYIALCLGDIGGPNARKALNHALHSEHNKDVVRHIRWGLATIAGDPSRYW